MFLLEIGAATIDDNLRDLRGSAVIQIDQRLAIHRLVQHRKFSANTLNIPVSAWSGLFSDGFFYCCHDIDPLSEHHPRGVQRTLKRIQDQTKLFEGHDTLLPHISWFTENHWRMS